jgi:hypothetical protein
MRIVAGAIIVTAGVADLVGSALAADMTGDQIKFFVSGTTGYLETTADSSTGKAGQGVIYWAADGTSLYKTPMGVTWHGKWEIKGNTLCPNWKEKPNGSCARFDKAGDTIVIVDAVSGKTRAKIVKTAVGNAENLKP